MASPTWAQAEEGTTSAPPSGAVPRGAQGAAVRQPKQEKAPEPVVVWPSVVHYEPPVYPEEARAKGLEAEVKLELVLDKEGNVTKATAIEPVGNGFDEAAEAAAMKMRFTPATRDGQPVVAKWGWVYRFTLEVEAEEVAAPTTGTLEGQLRIFGAETPLAGATVRVVGPDGKEITVATDAEGRWALERMPPGKYRVSADADGFDSVELDEEVDAGEATELVYRLSATIAEDGVLEVVVEGERPPREVTKRTIERREMNRIPGTSGDALRSIQSLPGVARPPGLAGLLIVRGSAPQDTAYVVDGAGVPLIYHFGGLSSVVPTELLDRIDFYPGNFGVKYGQVQGGMVDVVLRSPDTDCYGDYAQPTDKTGCYHGMAQVDLIDGRVLLQGPVAGSKNWRFALGGRRSWVDVWAKPALEAAGSNVTTAPIYSDYQAIVDYVPSSDERFSTRLFGSDDRFEIIVEDPASEDPGFGGNLTFRTRFIRAQSLYEKQLSKNVELTTMLSFGRDRIDFSIGTFLFDLNLYPASMRSEFGFKLAPSLRLNTGLDFLAAWFDVHVRAPSPPRPGEPAPGPFASRPPLETRTKGFGFRPGWYTDLEWQATERLRLVPGVRVDYAADAKGKDLSPRLIARYALVKEGDSMLFAPRKTTLKAGVGVFHQPPTFQETDEVFGTPELLSNRAFHYALGFEQELSQQVELTMEGFYKDLRRQVSRSLDARGAFGYGNEGEGRVYGLETLLKYRPDERFFGWAAYTLSRSVRKDGPDQEERPFEWDQTHNLVVLGSYRLGDGWEFGARFRVVSGNLRTPVAGSPSLPAIYAADAGSYVPLEGEPYSVRLPVFHQLDVRLDKGWQFKTWRLGAYLDVQNVYNHAAVEDIGYNYNFTQQQYQTGLPIIPSIGLRGEF